MLWRLANGADNVLGPLKAVDRNDELIKMTFTVITLE
jgi:hypothetical protein